MRLREAYEEMVHLAGRPEHGPRLAEMRRVFVEKTGDFGPENPWFEARSRAFWDDALTHQGFAQEVATEVREEARAWVAGLMRAHRGLFRAVRRHERMTLVDVWGGAEFLVDEIDQASYDAIEAATAPFDGHIAARKDPLSIALLPGAIFHPAEAQDALEAVLSAARAQKLETPQVLDALLRMELSLRTLSRVKPAYAYRPEALAPHSLDR
jgi:hypothetical protein